MVADSYSLRKRSARTRKLMISHAAGCSVCGFNFKAVLVVHHIVPIEHGGSNKFSNRVVLCPTCHSVTHKLNEKNKPDEYYGAMVHSLLERYTWDQIVNLKSLTVRDG